MARKQANRNEYWRQLAAEHERSGLTVRAFCEQARVNEHSFYNWRARLRRQEPVRFALVEPTGNALPGTNGGAAIELTLATGERLRIPAGADRQTLQTVLAILRA